MPLLGGLSILTSIGGFFKAFGWKKWAVLLIIGVVVFTLWHYRGEVQELSEKLKDANREIQTLEAEMEAERFMQNLDNILVDDLEDQTDLLAEEVLGDREQFDDDLDALRQRIREEVRAEYKQQGEQVGSDDAIECRQEEATRESVDRAVIDRISERMFRVYSQSQGATDGADRSSDDGLPGGETAGPGETETGKQ